VKVETNGFPWWEGEVVCGREEGMGEVGCGERPASLWGTSTPTHLQPRWVEEPGENHEECSVHLAGK